MELTTLATATLPCAPAPRPADSALIEALGIPCARFDARDRLADCNSAFRRAFDIEAPLPRRKEFLARFERFDGDVCCDDGSDCEENGRSCEEMFCPQSGHSYRLQWSRLPAGSGGGRLLTVTNLSERLETLRHHRALQDQLLFTSRAMSVGEMATTLAHELNQPLAAIINYLGTARRLCESLDQPPPRMQQALELARSQAEHSAAVIARLREFVRTREPRRERSELRQIVEQVLQLQQLEAQKHHVRVRCELPASLPAVVVDPVMIQQVLSNLIRNAIDAMRSMPPSERRLRISAKRNADERVEVRVADSGCGMDLADPAQVFAPFFTTKENGMGVGLSICRSIVEYHEGSLYFERNPGGGTVFVFTLTPAAH
jgi:signal transduction histidine kinase